MCDYIIDPGRSNHKYENYLKKEIEAACHINKNVSSDDMSHSDKDWCTPCFSGAHNFRIVLMWSNENGIKHRIDFPVRDVSYDGNHYKVFLTNYHVMHNLYVKINTLNGNGTQYGLYLSYEDYYNKTTNTPMKVVNFAKRTYLLPLSGFSPDDCFVNMEVYMDQFTKFVAELFYEMTKDVSVYYGNFKMPRIMQIWYNSPYTTIKWSDTSVTTSKCSSTETFSKEVGVSMCISKKYLECRGYKFHRKSFKTLVDSGVDLKEIHDKRDRKKALKRAIDLAKAGYSIDEIIKTLNLTDNDMLKKAIDMAKVGYSMDDIKQKLNLTNDVLDLFKDNLPKE